MPTLVHSPAEILAHLLVRVGQCTTVDDDGQTTGDWPVSANIERREPDACVTVYDTEDSSWLVRDLTGDVTGPEPFQLRVAAATNRIARAKAASIYDYLSRTLDRQFVTVESRYYEVQCCDNFRKILTLGKETPTSKRSVVVFNAAVTIVDMTP